MANKRKSISKSLRFEVFKRDSFTCQYCGSMAPDVVLEIDHINPVANGGENEIMNLVTSCYDCNRGKGAKELSDNQVIKKQQDQLKELNEKREQMKMMLEWKTQLNNFIQEQVDIFDESLHEHGRSLTESGRQNFVKWIKKYGFNEVYNSFEISMQQYGSTNDDASFSKVIDYVPRIIENIRRQQKDPLAAERQYIRAILRNKGMLYNDARLWKMLDRVCNVPNQCSEVKQIAMVCRSWSDFWDQVNDTFEGCW